MAAPKGNANLLAGWISLVYLIREDNPSASTNNSPLILENRNDSTLSQVTRRGRELALFRTTYEILGNSGIFALYCTIFSDPSGEDPNMIAEVRLFANTGACS